jgi:hypothetical protein
VKEKRFKVGKTAHGKPFLWLDGQPLGYIPNATKMTDALACDIFTIKQMAYDSGVRDGRQQQSAIISEALQLKFP